MRYRLSFPAPQTHHLHVALELEQPGDGLELALPVWTPGSYLVREFARHLEQVEASDETGCPVPVVRLDKHRWRLDAGAAARVTVRYRVYANDLTVRTSHVDQSHAFLSPAGVFLAARGRETGPHRVEVALPPGWRVATALEGGPTHFTARDYDELVDSPLEIGEHEAASFQALGREHQVVVWGRGNHDLARLVRDVQRIVEAHGAFWGSLPYRRYVFVVHLTGKGRGGLEHLASSVLLVPRLGFGSRQGYEDVLGLVSHEFFHLWNVKRLRPAALTPYDYGREQYTRLLWWFEGATSYYEQLTLVRAGLLPPARHQEALGRLFTTLWRTPGAAKTSAEESSLLAWVKLYRPDENTANSTVSYYVKGELVALALDLALRRAGASLDEVLRQLYARHAQGGVPEDGVERVVAELVGAEAAALLFDQLVRGVGPLEPDLELVGLRLRRRPARGPDDKGGKPARPEDGPPHGWLGAELSSGPRLAVTSVREGSPAWLAGLTADDELLAEGGFRLDRAGLAERLEERGPAGALRLTLFRRDALHEVEVPLGAPPEDTAWLEPVEAPSQAQRAAFQAWCGQPFPSP
ncbi:MAG: M61 family metallopeptidase [Anaeromyxobacter sp.]|nr:M61 family metallopeptidase [Anaeromyxobacter sp.]MBL0276257.1 M61 family metallopeptidase [Anaeromyxobacter sp.]